MDISWLKIIDNNNNLTMNRVSYFISRRNGGEKDGYFATKQQANVFYGELTHLLVNQIASFNSPVWFNCGIEPKPQISACFINSINDSMESILELAKTQGMLFKWGSGTGTNLSPFRFLREKRSTSGESSSSVFFQNANHTVRVTDDFMQVVVQNKPWQTWAVTTGEIFDTFQASNIMDQIAAVAP